MDNTFATPFGQRPLELGADLVLHSLTKNLGGFGTELGGAVICPRKIATGQASCLYRKDLRSGILSSKSAWAILVYGLPTLPAALEAAAVHGPDLVASLAGSSTPAVHAHGLSGSPELSRSESWRRRQMRDFDGDFAPGNMIYFEFDPEAVDATDFADAVASKAYSITLAVSLGHTKTLLEIPAAMTHCLYADAPPKAVRLSIGLESPADIVADLWEAIDAVRKDDVECAERRPARPCLVDPREERPYPACTRGHADENPYRETAP